MYRANLLIFLFAFLSMHIFGQEPEHKVTGKIDINTLIAPIDTLNDYVIFNKRPVEYRIEKKMIKEKAFFINVPKGVNFQLYCKQGKVAKYYFSNNKESIVVEIHPRKPKGVSVLKYCTQNEKADVKKETPYLQGNDRYAGFYFTGNYEIYYYNVEKDKLDYFNYAIQSIREKK